ncbi:MAG: glycosyltransferase family 2 protein [Deltaproteobacteria bacterium]|nr:glycosyltransferase family 2 protein [Deltaproteobacteria bacterium]
MSDESPHPLISVIIVNYNGKKFLSDCLNSIFRQTYFPFEVIMVDNASHDGSVEYVQQNFPEVKMLNRSTNLGFAGGTNAGIRQATGEYIFTLNNDTIADSHMLEEIVRPMQLDSRVGVCGSKILLPNGRINSTAICISRSGAAWDRGMGEPDHGQYDMSEEVFGACAGAALYRRSMLEEIGLFDEDFFLFMEDVDLAFRAQLAGWKCMYVPTSRVVHIHGGTANAGSDTAVYYVNRNFLWYVIKNFPFRTFVISLPWILGRNCAVIFYYTLSGKFQTILKAKADALKLLPLLIRKRRGLNKNVPGRTIEKWMYVWSRFPKS